MRTNVTPHPSSFFGRTDDLDRIAQLFAEGRRLVTLLAPAGAGKTRLARRFAELHADELRGGAWFCDVSEARDLPSALVAIAHSLGAPLRSTGTRDVGRWLAARGPTLVIVDNCEQVIDGAARIVSGLSEMAPELRVLATSREMLKIPGEHVHMVMPLGLPVPDEIDGDAVRLFVDRARAVHPGFKLSPLVGELVRRLDGLPLAIELAAARAAVMSVPEMLEKLGGRSHVFQSANRLAPIRQRTMGEAIDWSWDLLCEWEREAFAQCSVFRGGFGRVAGEAVLALSSDAPPTIDVLHRLWEKSLLRSDVNGEARFAMYDSIREYARAKPHGGAEERHAAYFAELGGALGNEARDPKGDGARKQLAREIDNLRAAHEYALRAVQGGAPKWANLALLALRGMVGVYSVMGPRDMAVSATDATLTERVESLASPSLVAMALRDRAYLRLPGGSAVASLKDVSRALDIARRSRDEELELRCLPVLAWAQCQADDPEAAIASSQAAFKLAKKSGDQAAIGRAFGGLGATQLWAARLEEARSSLSRAVEIRRALGDRVGSAINLEQLAATLLELGEVDQAAKLLHEAVELSTDTGARRSLAWNLCWLGHVEHERGDLDAAVVKYDAAIGVSTDAGEPLDELRFRAARAGVLARQGKTKDSAAAFADLERDRHTPSEAMMHRCWLHLARSQEALNRGDGKLAIVERARAEDYLRAAPQVLNEDGRFTLRLLKRSLAECKSPLSAVRTDAGTSNALVVAEDGAWFRLPSGAKVDIAGRRNLKNLLVALVSRRISEPGEPMSLEAVISAGWPGDRASSAARSNRARVALSRLRNMGLRDVLISSPRGHLLDPSVPISISRRPSP